LIKPHRSRIRKRGIIQDWRTAHNKSKPDRKKLFNQKSIKGNFTGIIR